MRAPIIITIAIFISIGANAQVDSLYLDSLKTISNKLESQIDSIELLVKPINEKINALEYTRKQEKLLVIAANGIKATTWSETSLRKGPSPVEEKLVKIPGNSSLVVYEYNAGYLKVKYNDYIGWINEMYIDDKESLQDIRPKDTNSFSKGFTNTSYRSSRSSRKSYSSKSSGSTYVKGHYRTVNGKKVWVRGHYRKR